MKIRTAPELLRKAATSLKSKTDALKTRLVILASLRRRMALVGAASRRIHALVSSPDGRPNKQKKAASVDYYYDRALMLRKAMAAVTTSEDNGTGGPAAGHGSAMVVDLSETAVFDVDAHGFFPDWTQSLFDDDNCHIGDMDTEEDGDDDLVLDEPSIIEAIGGDREVQGLELNMDDDIDEACDMFIRRFRSRMDWTF